MSQPISIGQIINRQFPKPIEDGFNSELRFADCLLCPHTLKPTGVYGLQDGTHCNGHNMEQQTKIKESKCPVGIWK